MCSTRLVQRKTISHLLSLFASAQWKTQRFSAETARLFSALTQSARFTKHLVVQRLAKVRIKEALPFNLSMIVTSSLVPQSFHRSLNHFSESLKLRVDIWRRPLCCDLQRNTRTSLFISLENITKLEPCFGWPLVWCNHTLQSTQQLQAHLLFIRGQDENASHDVGLLYPGYHDCTVTVGWIPFAIRCDKGQSKGKKRSLSL